MREYLYRGKRTSNGEWVEGNLIKSKHNCYIITAEDIYYAVVSSNGHGSVDLNIVANDTIGEYTGLCDKNGKKIFEGDIVLTQAYRDKPHSSKFKEKRFVGVVDYIIPKYEPLKWIVRIDNEEHYKYCCGSWSEFYDCEVIGNIHDNPELLEVRD